MEQRRRCTSRPQSVAPRRSPRYCAQARTSRPSPLVYAAQNGGAAAVSELLHHGARVDGDGLRGPSALMMAAQDGHAAICYALRLRGARADVACPSRGGTRLPHPLSGWTALIIAARSNHAMTVAALLRDRPRADVLRDAEAALASATEVGATAAMAVLRAHLSRGG